MDLILEQRQDAPEGISPAALEPLRHIASALAIVRRYSTDPARTRDQEEFMSVSMDELERLLLELLPCVTPMEDDFSRERFLERNGLSYLCMDMFLVMERMREEMARDEALARGRHEDGPAVFHNSRK